VEFQEAIAVFVVVAEHLEKLDVVEVGHLNLLPSESAQLHKLSFATQSFDSEHTLDKFL